MKLCKDCRHFETRYVPSNYCKAPQNEGIDLVKGGITHRKTPEQLRTHWNHGDTEICGIEGAWWEAHQRG